MYHHSALQGIRQGNLLSGIEKIAKNNDLSKIKKSPASVPCWQVVLNLVRPGGVPVGPLGASYKTTRHTVPRKGPRSSNVGSRTYCQSPTPQGFCFPYNTIFFANFLPDCLQCGRAAALCPPQPPLIEAKLASKRTANHQHRRGIKDSRIIRTRVFDAYSRSD